MENRIILKTGLRSEEREMVNDENTAQAWGSGGLPVYATPAMVALMEKAAAAAVAEELPKGFSTVGTELTIKHLAATPPGMEVRAAAELTEAEGRRLLFKVEAFDEAGKIGEGVHSRFIVENERFVQKAEAKKGI
ncbi:MAG: thioesterase family protein [Spirochaetaceae bacterium]|jgi:predicted thioesterase|nr:thioesterase family protein [Spirochaetaceae bacterium]